MKLDEGDQIVVGVDTAKAPSNHDVLLTTAPARASASPFERCAFQGPRSTGVRGINLGQGDVVIERPSSSISTPPPDERAAYLKDAAAARQGAQWRDGEDVTEAAVAGQMARRFRRAISSSGSSAR